MGQGILRSLWLIAGLLCFGQAASAKVALRVEFGWEWQYQPGQWAPVYVTVSDSNAQPARNVQLEIYSPQDDLYAMRVFQHFAIRSEPTTFIVYVPLTYQISDTVAVIRDAESGRKLAETSFDQALNPGGVPVGNWYAAYGSTSELVIGASGRRSGLSVLQGPFEWTDQPKAVPDNQYSAKPSIRVGFLEPARLPDAMVGYEALNILMLNAPDLVNLTAEQQEAMAGWVRGGGCLLMWPGERAMPPDSAIVKMLPCQVGTITATELSLEETKEYGLASRVSKVGGRELAAAPWAKRIPLFRDKATVCYGRVGLGSVGVLSVDASQLVFENRDAAVKFWRPILKAVIHPASEGGDEQSNNYVDPRNRRYWAKQAVVQRLGDVPGVGTFDFSYIAIVMIAMMLIVGPIDWFVLKKLGKQPWTWATTAGWIVLVTVGALYIGYVFRSGDLHYRTLRMIDQADGKVVGATEVTAIYSPRTQRYQFETPRDGWWKPAPIGEIRPWRNSPGIPNELPAVQDVRSNRPLSATVNVWSLCFLEGMAGDPGGQAAVIEATLRLDKTAGSTETRIAGTITNRSGQTLSGIEIQTSGGIATLGSSLKPDETATIDLPLRKERSLENWRKQLEERRERITRMFEVGRPAAEADADLMYAAGDLVPQRTDRIIQVLSAEANTACIYGIANEASPTTKLLHGNREAAKERHYQIIRALVPLQQME